MKLRAELESVVGALLVASERSRQVTLDAIGDAIGARAVSHDEVDAILQALELRGRRVIAPEGGGGEERLRTVVVTARALTTELSRRPTIAEIASRSGLAEAEVRQALFLARVIQR
ncbi:MAG TPA: sigma-70 domain-containing protein [Labilithrix sp.]|jgi:hypothetical protein